jgi:hypothetical protein
VSAWIISIAGVMEANLKKTQIMIMIFEKKKIKKAKPVFTLGNGKISVVQEHCYLSIELNRNGNFALAILHRKLGSDVPFQLLLIGRPCMFGLLAEYFCI